MTSWWRNERILLLGSLLCLSLSMICENSMTTMIWRRRYMILHAIQLHVDATQHAKQAALDEFLAWEDEVVQAQLATQAKRLWNRTEMDYDQMMESENNSRLFSSLAAQEERKSLAEEKEAQDDAAKFNLYYQQAQQEAFLATHLKEDYCEKYYVPSYWCRWVAQFAGWESIQAQQAMQSTNDMRLAVIEEQASQHAAQLARVYHINASRHAQLANWTAWQARLWNESYQRDREHVQQLDAEVHTLSVMSRDELNNATFYANEAQQEWEQAISLAHYAISYQHQATLYSIVAIVLASIVLMVAFHHLLTLCCQHSMHGGLTNQASSSYEKDLRRIAYAFGHFCIFFLVLGGMLKNGLQGDFVLLEQDAASVATSNGNRGGTIIIFAVHSASMQWICFHLPLVWWYFCHHNGGVSSPSSDYPWQAGLIHGAGALLKHFVMPVALFAMEILIIVNLRCVAVFFIDDITWWLLFFLLFIVAAIHFLVNLPKIQGSSSVDSTNSDKQVFEDTRLLAVTVGDDCSKKAANRSVGDGDDDCIACYDSDVASQSRCLVDVELSSTATTRNSPPRTAVWCGGCFPHVNGLLEDEIMSVREHASFLETPLAVLIVARTCNLVFFNCLPMLHRLEPSSPTWLVPVVMMVIASCLVVQSAARRRQEFVWQVDARKGGL